MIKKAIIVLLLHCVALTTVQAQTKKPEKKQKQNVLELETLRIEGYIYEPQILFILEKPSIELISAEETKRHDFLKNIDKPLFKTLY